MKQVEAVLKVITPYIVIEHPVSRRARSSKTISVRSCILVAALNVRIIVDNGVFFHATCELGHGIGHRQSACHRDISRIPGIIVHIYPCVWHGTNVNMVQNHADTHCSMKPIRCQTMNEDVCHVII